MIRKARKILYLFLDRAAEGPLGATPRVFGPFRVVQFAPDGIYASASPSHPLHIATVNMAGHYVLLEDGSEWVGARVVAPEDKGDPPPPEAP